MISIGERRLTRAGCVDEGRLAGQGGVAHWVRIQGTRSEVRWQLAHLSRGGVLVTISVVVGSCSSPTDIGTDQLHSSDKLQLLD